MIFICQRVWKTVKCQGQIREKSGNFEVDDKWQPCIGNPESETYLTSDKLKGIINGKNKRN